MDIFHQFSIATVDGCEILQQLGWLKPIKNNGMLTTSLKWYRVSSIHSLSYVSDVCLLMVSHSGVN